MNDVVESDGLGDFDLEQIGQRTGAFGGARLLKYVTDHFVTREGEVIEPEREMICLGLKKIVQMFINQKLMDTIVVPNNEKMPDINAMNDAAPRSEWGTDLNGNPVGPFTRVLVLKLLDAKSMERFAFVTSSVGGSIAVGDLSDKCKIMRRFKGPNAVPLVSCNTTVFKTKFGTRKRPDFRVLRWITLSDAGGGELPPKSEQPKLEQPKPQKMTAAPASTFGKPVTLGEPIEPPTIKQEMEDEIPF